MMRNLLSSISRNEEGTTAVEFAIIAPVFILLVLGTIALCFALFLIGSLHFAVEDGARCASVKTSICADYPTTIAYTQSRYLGPNVLPTFTYNNPASCGPRQYRQLRDRDGQLHDGHRVQEIRRSDFGNRLFSLTRTSRGFEQCGGEVSFGALTCRIKWPQT